jgi:hypothetical protein
MAHHGFLLHFVAAVARGPEQGRGCLDAAIRVKPFTMEPAVFVLALVRFPLLLCS